MNIRLLLRDEICGILDDLVYNDWLFKCRKYDDNNDPRMIIEWTYDNYNLIIGAIHFTVDEIQYSQYKYNGISHTFDYADYKCIEKIIAIIKHSSLGIQASSTIAHFTNQSKAATE